jgi:hypothetical protein
MAAPEQWETITAADYSVGGDFTYGVTAQAAGGSTRHLSVIVAYGRGGIRCVHGPFTALLDAYSYLRYLTARQARLKFQVVELTPPAKLTPADATLFLPPSYYELAANATYTDVTNATFQPKPAETFPTGAAQSPQRFANTTVAYTPSRFNIRFHDEDERQGG